MKLAKLVFALCFFVAFMFACARSSTVDSSTPSTSTALPTVLNVPVGFESEAHFVGVLISEDLLYGPDMDHLLQNTSKITDLVYTECNKDLENNIGVFEKYHLNLAVWGYSDDFDEFRVCLRRMARFENVKELGIWPVEQARPETGVNYFESLKSLAIEKNKNTFIAGDMTHLVIQKDEFDNVVAIVDSTEIPSYQYRFKLESLRDSWPNALVVAGGVFTDLYQEPSVAFHKLLSVQKEYGFQSIPSLGTINVVDEDWTDYFSIKEYSNAWGFPEKVEGDGTPEIVLDPVLEIGNPDYDTISGKVLHLEPYKYYVYVFIKVGGRWWIKPYEDSTATYILADGSFEADVTTGGYDSEATDIAIFVVDRSIYFDTYSVFAEIPEKLIEQSSAFLTVTRR